MKKCLFLILCVLSSVSFSFAENKTISGKRTDAVTITDYTNTTPLKVDAHGGISVVNVSSAGVEVPPASATTQTDGTQKTQIVDATGTSAKVEARKQTPTGNAINVQIGPGDIISNIPVFLDFGQHQVHEGESHNVQYYSTNVNTIEFSVVVPTYVNTINAPHMLIHMDVYEGAAELSVWEGATYTGGTLAPSFNRNRNSLTAPGASVYTGTVAVLPGNRLPMTLLVGAGGVASKTTGEGRGLDEFVLKSNTIYRVVLEEISAITRAVVHFEWYEDLGV